jgi:translation initiation factor IF-2
VGIDRAAQARAEQVGVDIRNYNIIYKMIEDVELALTGMLEPIYQEVKIGEAQVLQLFKLRRGVIAGCTVLSGVVRRNALARGKRKGEDLTPMTRIETLRRFTEDATEVRTGFECGIRLAVGDDLLQEGDTIEVYERQRVR